MTRARRPGSLHKFGFAFSASLVLALGGCRSTLDSLGGDLDASLSTGPDASSPDGAAPPPVVLKPLTGPASYGNAFHDLLGKSDADIAAKLAAAFTQLFHGDASTQSFYATMGSNQAIIQDIYHTDVRTEGLGLGMIITVELDKRDEFDRLWNYAKAFNLQTTGPQRGYFKSYCDDDTTDICFDSYGMQQFVTALLFANDRWNSDGAASYGTDASALLDVLQNKERENGGVVSGVTDIFDPTTLLVREQPVVADAGYTRSAQEIPAMYDLWAAATGNAFWSSASAAARTHTVASANASTGLWPTRSYFDGSPVPNYDTYVAQGYRNQLNLALDALWGSATAAEGDNADRVLAFFTAQGLDKSGFTYKLDGTVIDGTREVGLVAMNGALAVASSRANRADFVNAVWTMEIPSGAQRYYDGILYLVSLLVLSGQYRVY
jgi:oligosaccharide reducing-end xylanase